MKKSLPCKTCGGKTKMKAGGTNKFPKVPSTAPESASKKASAQFDNPNQYKKGGSTDKKWMQKAVNPEHKGYCTPMSKPTCTPKRKALARTFKAMAKARKGK